MNAISIFHLFSLAAIWGGSFLFMRIAASTFSTVWLVEFRVGLAALFLTLVAWFLRKPVSFRKHYKHFFILGFFNSALPFFLFSYGAQTLTASLLSILNATAPIWGGLIMAIWYKEKLTPKAMLGMCLGIVGVSILVGFDSALLEPGSLWAVFAAVGAACSYGIATTYTRSAVSVEAFSNAYGSMWGASLILLPLLSFFPMYAAPDITASTTVMSSVLALGIVCSGIAYLLYFRLVADIGAASTLTVTFLIPMFGVLWGSVVLDEMIGWHTLIGSLVVVTGTALVTGFSPRVLFRSKMV